MRHITVANGNLRYPQASPLHILYFEYIDAICEVLDRKGQKERQAGSGSNPKF